MFGRRRPHRIPSSGTGLFLSVVAALIFSGGCGPLVEPTAQPAQPTEPLAEPSDTPATPTQSPPTAAQEESDDRLEERMKMVETQIRRRGVTDQDVLAALERVPRHEFVPDQYQSQAYADHPLPIGHGQTISQPYIVALMTELLD